MPSSAAASCRRSADSARFDCTALHCCASLSGALGRMLRQCRLSRWLQDEVIFQEPEWLIGYLLGRRRAPSRKQPKLGDQRRLHAVDHISLDIGAGLLEQMGDDLVMAGRIDQKVNMRWPHRADLGSAHQLPTLPSIGME